MSGPFVTLVLACGVAGQVPAPQPPSSVGQLTIGAPVEVATIGSKEASGQPIRLAWNAEGSQLYIRTSVFDRWANETATHLLISIRAGQVARVTAEPGWASQYWSWKSGPVSPADPSLRVDLEIRTEIVRTTNVPREGNIGQNVADPSAGLDETVINAARASQQARFETLTLRGRVIDRTVNEHLMPGRTFGWAPAPHAFVAFVSEKQRLVLMDRAGGTREVRDAKNAMLPAWSPDGTRIAFLQKGRGDTFTLRIVAVGS